MFSQCLFTPQNGVLSSLPYLVTWVCNIIAGALADFLRKPNRLRTVHVRKIMVCLGECEKCQENHGLFW